MPGVTDTQSIRFGLVTDPIDWTMVRNEADDIATQLDAADVAKLAALTRPIVKVRRVAAQALPVGVATAISWDSTVQDTHGMSGVGTGTPTRVTVSAAAGAGHYMVAAAATLNSASWTRGDMQLFKNGGLIRARELWFPPGGSLGLSAIVWLGAVADFLDLRIYHEGGGSDNTVFVQLTAYKLCNN
jgi:hypothetical protein